MGNFGGMSKHPSLSTSVIVSWLPVALVTTKKYMVCSGTGTPPPWWRWDLDIPEAGGQVRGHVLVELLKVVVLLDAVEGALADDNCLLHLLLVTTPYRICLLVETSPCPCRCPRWPPWVSPSSERCYTEGASPCQFLPAEPALALNSDWLLPVGTYNLKVWSSQPSENWRAADASGSVSKGLFNKFKCLCIVTDLQ